jgi:arginyl-tRNA--protein-N-Asp/Glu arginylyltransferase
VKTAELYHFSEPCPYLDGKRSSGEFLEGKEYFPDYETLILFGWRRSGTLLYRYRCDSCSLCIPIRLPVARLLAGKRFSRLKKLNRDITMKLCQAEFQHEHFALYEKYINFRHGGMESSSKEAFSSILDVKMASIAEYRNTAGKLCAIGFLDLLPKGLSSVYFAFDPEESRRSLGTYSVFAESTQAMGMGKEFYYLGFWVPHACKMDYKADFRPFQLAIRPGTYLENYMDKPCWMEFRDRTEALSSLSATAHR